MATLRIELFTKIDRNQAISLVGDLISHSDGWIVSHQLFSNISASIFFGMPSSSIDDFIHSLNQAGFTPSVTDSGSRKKDGDQRGVISITFIHNDPDLKRDVPAFG